MANKKFYYRNKSKSSSKDNMQQRSKALENYSEQQLALSLDDMGLSDAAKALLSGAGIEGAAALVVRSEKDMYKIQGLNKRVLGEVKGALASRGMSLYKEEQSADAAKPQGAEARPQNAEAKPKAQAEEKRKSGENKKAQKQDRQDLRETKREGGSKFGLADRREQPSKQSPKCEPKPARAEKAPTEPLPTELWRKVLKGGKWGFTDGFKTVIPPMYDEVFSFKEGLASVEIDGKCGYIDPQNNVVIPLDYDLAMSFSEGLAMVAKGEKCGYINRQNEVVIDFSFDAATPFEGGEAKVKKDGKWATLTTDGKLTWI